MAELELVTIDDFLVTPNNAEYGYIVEVDTECLENMHDTHSATDWDVRRWLYLNHGLVTIIIV